MSQASQIYRLYRLYPQGHEQQEQRLIARFAIVGGQIYHLEDHDHVIDDIVPQGPVTPRIQTRIAQLRRSPYWRLVLESDIDQGHHPDLLADASGGEPWKG